MGFTIICTTPKEHCNGFSPSKQNAMLGRKFKHHKTHEEVYSCMVKYLLSQGYKKVGKREFRKGDEPVLIISKKSKIGLPTRRGKERRPMCDQMGHGGIA